MLDFLKFIRRYLLSNAIEAASKIKIIQPCILEKTDYQLVKNSNRKITELECASFQKVLEIKRRG